MEEVRTFVYVYLTMSISTLLFMVGFILWKTLIKKEEINLFKYKSPYAGKKGC